MCLTWLVATDPGGNSILDYAYDYDSTGNIVSKTTEHGTYSYGYDSASRLTSADNPTLEDEHYSYDAVGNRTSASNADGSITHNANNELTVYGDVEYVYDANGNMTEVKLSGQVMFSYHYNAENRLVKVEGGNNNPIVEYSYDPFGRRLWKDVGGTRTYFFYADEGLVAEYDSSGTELKTYGYRPDSTWTTDPLWLKQNGEYYFYQNDHLGTPQKLVQMNGAIVWSASYTAFGKATVDVETVTNNLRFPGQYFDAETGLHYNWFRYYELTIGRYLRVDPIGFEGGVNVFSYVLNNPLVNEDQQGLAVTEIGVGGAITTAALLGPIAAVGSGSCMYVWDDYGNKGIACCMGVGAATGEGFVAGIQFSHSEATESICDLQGGGFGTSFGGGGGFGYGAAGEVSVDPVYGTITGITIIAGFALGGYAGSGTFFGGCLLLMEFGNKCQEWWECQDEREARKRQQKAEEWLKAWQSRKGW